MLLVLLTCRFHGGKWRVLRFLNWLNYDLYYRHKLRFRTLLRQFLRGKVKSLLLNSRGTIRLIRCTHLGMLLPEQLGFNQRFLFPLLMLYLLPVCPSHYNCGVLQQISISQCLLEIHLENGGSPPLNPDPRVIPPGLPGPLLPWLKPRNPYNRGKNLGLYDKPFLNLFQRQYVNSL